MSTSSSVGSRNLASLSESSYDDEEFQTKSSIEQISVERNCLNLFSRWSSDKKPSIKDSLILNRESTVKFLMRGLGRLSSGYECLDASRPWILYWILHSLEILGVNITDSKLKSSIISFLSKCQNRDGGFGGGPGQLSHLAPTYAAVNALVILGGSEAYSVINRDKLATWMNSLRLSDGSFIMHRDGEVDIRGTYCALAVARLTNIYSEELFNHTAQWIVRCQTYEGGFGGVPGMEAHGGYSFCGIASLMLMKKQVLCDVDTLNRWASRRQMKLEGGFQGRTNKLVDGCYSFWQGGIFPLLHRTLNGIPSRAPSLSSQRWMFHQEALQEYLLICCQDPRGGLIDKPGKSRDFYHTCYTLSGLSVAQHFGDQQYIIGPKKNLLKQTHALFNICNEAVIEASEYFEPLAIPTISS